MTYTIEKEFHFSASHRLDGLPDGHPCGRLHGHNYIAKVRLESEVLDSVGFVLDYGRLAPVRRLIDESLDHQHLNDVLPVPNPTAEHMADWLRRVVLLLLADEPLPGDIKVSVGVSETPKTWAWAA